MGDGMMMKNVRILVAAAACVLLGMPLLAEEPVPVIQGRRGPLGPCSESGRQGNWRRSTIRRNLACG